jgi:hypothetical protein
MENYAMILKAFLFDIGLQASTVALSPIFLVLLGSWAMILVLLVMNL